MSATETKTELPPAQEKSFPEELRGFLGSFPDGGWFLLLLAGWIALFHFVGNATLGYVKTPSLFGWMENVYSNSPDDEHAYLIPFAVAALFWWKRDEIMPCEKKFWAWGLLGLGLALGLHVVGFLVQQTRISLVAFFFGLYMLMGLLWGPRFLRRSFFPMVMFIFCFPLGAEAERITFPLREAATRITGGLANHLLGIGIIRDGTRLFDPSGHYQYEVAAACSGMRSLTAVFAISTVFAFMQLRKNWRRAVLILAGFPLAVVSNVIRLLMIIVAADLFGQETGNYVHESGFFSMLPYIPALGGVVLLGWWLRRREDRATAAEGGAA